MEEEDEGRDWRVFEVASGNALERVCTVASKHIGASRGI